MEIPMTPPTEWHPQMHRLAPLRVDFLAIVPLSCWESLTSTVVSELSIDRKRKFAFPAYFYLIPLAAVIASGGRILADVNGHRYQH